MSISISATGVLTTQIPAEKKEKIEKEENETLFEEVKTGFCDWLNDEDKICTDGKDDGKLSFKEAGLSFLKGLGGIVKSAINHPILTGLAVAGGVALTVATGGAITPVLVALGATIGIGQIGYGTYKACTAENDAEAKQAFENIGNGTFALGASVFSAKNAISTAGKAGIIADKGDDLNALQATAECFKTTPKALKATGTKLCETLSNLIDPAVLNINGSNTLTSNSKASRFSNDVMYSLDWKGKSDYSGFSELPSEQVFNMIQDSSFNNNIKTSMIQALDKFESIPVRYVDYSGELYSINPNIGFVKFGGGHVIVYNDVSPVKALAALSDSVSPATKAFTTLMAMEEVKLIEDNK